MGLELARAFVTIHADMDSLHQELASGKEDIKRQIESMTGGFEKLGGLIGIGFGIHELISVSHEAVAAASEHMQATARLGAVIAATGGAAGYSAEQMEDYAKELAKVGIASKMQIVEAETALARHKEIRGEMFKRTVAASADLGAANQTNPAAAANMLGRALESPQRGMMMLRRLHVDISEEQRRQITQLTKLNQLDKAREIILTAVEASTRGFNAALANTPAGQLEKLEQKLHEAHAELGEKLMPAAIAWKQLQITLFEATARLIEPLGKMVLLAVKFNEAAGNWPVKIVGMVVAFGALSFVLGGIPALIATGIGAFVAFTESGQKLLEGFMEVVGGITAALSTGDWAAAGAIAMQALKTVMLEGLAAIAKAIGGGFGDFLGMLGDQILSGDLSGAWNTLVSGLGLVWAGFCQGVVTAFTAAANVVIDIWQKLARGIADKIQSLLETQEGFFTTSVGAEQLRSQQLQRATVANEALGLGVSPEARAKIEQAQKLRQIAKATEERVAKQGPGYDEGDSYANADAYGAIKEQRKKADALIKSVQGEIDAALNKAGRAVGGLGHVAASSIIDTQAANMRVGLAALQAQADADATKAKAAFHQHVAGGAGRAGVAAADAKVILDKMIEDAKNKAANVGGGGLLIPEFNFPKGRPKDWRGGGNLGLSPLDTIGGGRLGGFADVGKKIQDALIKGQTNSLEEQQVDLAKQGLDKQDQLIGAVRQINAGLK